MDKAAIDAGLISERRATAAHDAMRNAKSFGEFEAAWSDFLMAASRVYSKLEQGAKANGKSTAWFGRQKHERRIDPLLRYLHHARNVDEHGIERITELQPGSVGISSTGSTLIKHLEISNKGIKAETSGDPLIITVTPGRARLVRVIDRGDIYDPPTTHQDSPIKDQSPAGIAELAVLYLRAMIDDAAKLT